MGYIFGLIKLAIVFVFNSWLVMLSARFVSDELGIIDVSYADALLVTLSLWVVVTPIAYMVSKVKFTETQNW